MWTRAGLKKDAKTFLKKFYLLAFIASLIATVLMGDLNIEYETDATYPADDSIVQQIDERVPMDLEGSLSNTASRGLFSPFYAFFTGGRIFISLLLTIILVTLGYVIEVGRNRFYLSGFDKDINIKYVFSGLNRREYLPIIKTQFIRNLFVFLWTLLLIVPGIIKSYQYRMVPYILAENPDLTTRETLDLSKEMTDGQKMDIFVLDLSFIGWYILGGLFFGIGNLFVSPYVDATNTRLYEVLADRNQIHSTDELDF